MPTLKIYDLLDYGRRTDRNNAFDSTHKQYLSVGISAQGNGSDGYTSRTLFKFDLSKIPTNVIISQATLNVKVSYSTYSGNLSADYRNLAIHRITQNWTFDSLQYGYPSFENNYEAIKGSSSANTWDVLDVTNSVTQIYNNTIVNYGWILKHQSDNYSATYTSERDFYIPTDVDVNNRPYLEITYTIPPPAAPILNEPIGVYTDNKNVITFKWSHSNIQTKFDLMWSSSNGTTWTTVTQATSNKYYNMPANTLPDGSIMWKVKYYNENFEASSESASSTFYAIGKPDAPTITDISISTARPTVTWASVAQSVYQLQILQNTTVLYDSGEVASTTIKQQKVDVFLPDGDYIAKVRIKNEFGLYSEWGSQTFTVTTIKPSKPDMALSISKYAVNISLSNITNTEYTLIYRTQTGSSNYICIAKITGASYTDYTAESGKQYDYYAHAVSVIETYADSDVKTVTAPVLENAIIAPISDLSNIFEVKYNLNDRIIKSSTLELISTINHFSGREFPVIDCSEHTSFTLTITLFVDNDNEFEQLTDIVNKKSTILYKDNRRKFYGKINSINESDSVFGYAVYFSIIQVDYSDELEV